MADVRIENHGSIVLFRPLNDNACEWLETNVQSDAQWFGGALTVEPRYASDIANGLIASGFEVE